MAARPRPPRPACRRPRHPPMKMASGARGRRAPPGRGPSRWRDRAHRDCRRCGRYEPPAPGAPRSPSRDWRGRATPIRSRPSRSRRRCPRGGAPRNGRSAASVIALISRLVICPSFSNRSSGRPGAIGRGRASTSRDDLDRHDVQRVDSLRAKRSGPRARDPFRAGRRALAGRATSSRRSHARAAGRQAARASRHPKSGRGLLRAVADAGSPCAGRVRAATRSCNPAATSRAARARGRGSRARDRHVNSSCGIAWASRVPTP